MELPVERQEGIETAARHADEVVEAWTELAIQSVLDLSQPGDEFLAEEARSIAEDCGMPQPPDKRAWGFVFRHMARRGLLVRVGYRPARDGSPKSIWRRAA